MNAEISNEYGDGLKKIVCRLKRGAELFTNPIPSSEKICNDRFGPE